MTQILAGIRVLDVARYVAGPMAAAFLADLGADVVRIEPPDGADDRMPLPIQQGFHGGAVYAQTGRNKRGLALDLSSARGKEVFGRLATTADVVIANVPSSAAAVLGVDYESVAAIKPDIVYLHLTAFGSHGPYAQRVGFDGIAQVMCGMAHLSGEPGKPMKSVAPWVDMASGLAGAFGVLAALRHRDATGVGQKVDVDLFHTALTVSNYYLIDQAFTQAGRSGLANRAPSGAPADLLQSSDGWFYIAVLGNAMFKRFTRMVGREELAADPRFQSDEARAGHAEELNSIAAAWALQRTTQQALAELEKSRLPAGPLLTPQQVLQDAHVSEGLIEPMHVEGLSEPVPYVRPPVTFSHTPGSVRTPSPAIGQHTDAVLSEAGFSSAEIAELRRSLVI